MKKLTCAIIDYEIEAVNRLRYLLERFNDIHILFSSITPQEAFLKITLNNPDLVFIDIEMLGQSGFEIIKEVKLTNIPTKFILTTSSQQAIKANKTKYFDYLLKPINSIGREVFSLAGNNLLTDIIEISVSEYNPGIYYLIIISNEGVLRRKISIAK